MLMVFVGFVNICIIISMFFFWCFAAIFVKELFFLFVFVGSWLKESRPNQ